MGIRTVEFDQRFESGSRKVRVASLDDQASQRLPHALAIVSSMERTLLQRIHNPRNRTCVCPPHCWCNRTAIGRLVKWWLPEARLGVRHRPPRRLTERQVRGTRFANPS